MNVYLIIMQNFFNSIGASGAFLAFNNIVASLSPSYKIYRATITLTTTTANIVELENTIGGSTTWTRVDDGFGGFLNGDWIGQFPTTALLNADNTKNHLIVKAVGQSRSVGNSSYKFTTYVNPATSVSAGATNFIGIRCEEVNVGNSNGKDDFPDNMFSIELKVYK